MTLPSGTGASTGEPLQPGTTVASSERPIWPIPVLIGVGGAISALLHTVAIIATMVHPAAGITIGVVTVVGAAVGSSAVYRGWSGRWHPIAAALLALLSALPTWGGAIGFLPMAFGLLSGPEGGVIAGIVVGALATLVLPGRWRIVGWIAAALFVLLQLAVWSPVVLEAWSELFERL